MSYKHWDVKLYYLTQYGGHILEFIFSPILNRELNGTSSMHLSNYDSSLTQNAANILQLEIKATKLNILSLYLLTFQLRVKIFVREGFVVWIDSKSNLTPYYSMAICISIRVQVLRTSVYCCIVQHHYSLSFSCNIIVYKILCK